MLLSNIACESNIIYKYTVSILILMDVALESAPTTVLGSGTGVSILILMDVALESEFFSVYKVIVIVSILILMDVALESGKFFRCLFCKRKKTLLFRRCIFLYVFYWKVYKYKPILNLWL